MFRALAMWQRSNHSNRANQRRMADKNIHRLLGFTNEWWFTIILRVILMVIFHLSKFLWFGDRFCMALSVVDPEIPDTSSSISITECLDLKDHWVFFHRCPIRMVRIDPLGPPKFSETFLETQGPRRNRGLWMWGMLHIGRDYIWTHLGMLISHIWRSDPSNQIKQMTYLDLSGMARIWNLLGFKLNITKLTSLSDILDEKPHVGHEAVMSPWSQEAFQPVRRLV